jgi:hypothetical protein
MEEKTLSHGSPKGTVEKVVLGVPKWAVFSDLNILLSQSLQLFEKSHQQAGALRFRVFQHTHKECGSYTTYFNRSIRLVWVSSPSFPGDPTDN